MRIIKALVLVLLLLFTLAIPVLADDDSLLGDYSSSPGYWEFGIRNSVIHNNPGIMIGGSSGHYINDSFAFGTEGYILFSQIQAPAPYTNKNIQFFYAGLTGEYTIIKPAKFMSISGLVSAGLGYVKYFSFLDGDFTGKDGMCLVVEPGVNVMMNITDKCQAGVGVSYRLTSGITAPGLTDDDFKSISVNINFRFKE